MALDLHELPTDVLSGICSWLDPRSLLCFYHSCRRARGVALQHVRTLSLVLPQNLQQSADAATCFAAPGRADGRELRLSLKSQTDVLGFDPGVPQHGHDVDHASGAIHAGGPGDDMQPADAGGSNAEEQEAEQFQHGEEQHQDACLAAFITSWASLGSGMHGAVTQLRLQVNHGGYAVHGTSLHML